MKALYAAPTALRAIRREDPTGELVKDYDLSNLQGLYVRCDLYGCPHTSKLKRE